VEVAAGLSHGEAVAVGMVAAGAASEMMMGFGGAGRQRAAITRLGLPTEVAGVARSDALALMALDKKRDRSGLRMTLLRDIADPVLVPVDPATVDAALEAVGIT
jgi:3-dehydroquinate synthetase